MATETITIFSFIDQSSFWSSFFAQLLSTIIVVIMGSIFAPIIWDFLNRTRMLFRTAHSWKNNKFKFSQSDDKQYETTLNLVVVNEGRKTIERFYWEMFIEKDEDTSVDILTKPPYPQYFTSHNKKDGDFEHIYGYIEMPIFPGDYIDFVLEIKIKRKTKKKTSIYYFFRSDYGLTPVWSYIALRFKKYSWLKKIIIE